MALEFPATVQVSIPDIYVTIYCEGIVMPSAAGRSDQGFLIRFPIKKQTGD
jgi:hypothetical protein